MDDNTFDLKFSFEDQKVIRNERLDGIVASINDASVLSVVRNHNNRLSIQNNDKKKNR